MHSRLHGFPLLAGMTIVALLTAGLFLQAGHAADDKPVIRNSLGMSFVLIPAGSFTMGSPAAEYGRAANETRHRVTLTRPIYMQTTEVTVDQWHRLMGRRWFGGVTWSGDYPIAKVSWHDVQRFIRKLNAKNEGFYRLPTEAEWEYAARAGSQTAYAWGDHIDCSRAMYSNSRKGTSDCRDYNFSRDLKNDMPAPVTTYAPNRWGLYDMHGNVWEWCEDLFAAYPDKPAKDPCQTSSGTMRVRRGGSWFKHGYSCRAANRAYGHPASRMPNTGFRLVRDPKGPSARVKPVPRRPADADFR